MSRSLPDRPGASVPVGRANKPRRRRKLVKALLGCVVLGLVLLVAWCSTLFVIILRYDGSPAGGKLRPADVGIVLGAQLWQDKPSPALRERLEQALKVYRDGSVRHLIVSGGLDAEGATITEAEGMRNYLTARGVPADDIVLEDKSRSTVQNLEFSKRIMDDRGWSSAVIVTHQYHGSRAGNMARWVGYRNVQVSVTDSQVMNMAYHRTREVLAYTKWLGEKWLLHGG